MKELADRLDYLVQRLRTTYDGIGHSSGRPYVYFVYPVDQERVLRRLADDHLSDDGVLRFHHIDLVPLTVTSISGQEERREEMLADPARSARASEALATLWAEAVGIEIEASLEGASGHGRPVVVLRGLAALHPVSNPTALMEVLAEQEPRDPATRRIVPIVVLVPGSRPPATSRTYLFLGLEHLRLSFYRGEED